MSTSVTRIYSSPRGGADIIGFSRSCAYAMQDPRFARFFHERDYVTRAVQMTGFDFSAEDTEYLPNGGVSYAYVEIQPPLTDQHIQEFGGLCVGGYEKGIIDPGHNTIVVLDNRGAPPKGPYGSGVLIANG